MIWGGEKTQNKRKDTEKKKERRNISSAWKERKQRRQLHRNSLLQWRGRWKTLRKKYTKFSEEKSCKKGTSSSQVRPQNSKLTVSKAIWNHVLPKSKYKMVRSLKVSTEIPKGINRANGMEIGVSICNPWNQPGKWYTFATRKVILWTLRDGKSMSRHKENGTSSFWKGRESTCLVESRHN